MGETTGRMTQFPQKRKQGRGGNYRLKCSGWRCTFLSNSNKLTVKKKKVMTHSEKFEQKLNI